MDRTSATPPASAAAPALDPDDALVLRPLKTHADFGACVALQRATWGETYNDCVPASILKISQRVGGVAAGAFSREGELLGFVYGLTGVEHGHLIHWSHMLAVQPDYRNHGIGRRLKEYQRELLVRLGVEWMYWTFDPLVARNAHLNLARLGARVREYVPDMYGDTGSELHAFGTDRFVVSWPVVARRPHATDGAGLQLARSAPVANRAPDEESETGGVEVRGPVARIRVPSDVESMQVDDLARARAWRASTREAFMRLLGDGYIVIGFYCEGFDRCYYVLARARQGGNADGPASR